MILISFGTRPEYIKLKPIMDIFAKNNFPYKVLFTGQHTDLLPPGASLEIDYRLEIERGTNRLDAIVRSVMCQSHIWVDSDITHVMVQGDTTSAFAVGLAAFHRKIPVIHLEAGLRTYDNDNPYPEEFNRQALSRLASIHLCPTKMDALNLRSESTCGAVYVVGNTVLDHLTDIKTSYNDKVLVTMHRRENHEIMDKWFDSLEGLAEKHSELEFVFVSHPNPNVQKHLGKLKRVKVIDPLPHKEFVQELAQCRFLITDSGGLQEESSFFRKKSVVCRKLTERKAGVGTFSKLCYHPEDLSRYVSDVVRNHEVPDDWECPYGDGRSAKMIYTILRNILE